MKSFEEWVEQYEKKTGVKFEPDDRATLHFDPEKGFAEVGVLKNMVIIGQLAGDAKYWKRLAEEFARKLNISHLGTWCIRNIEAYIRFFGVEIEEIEDAGGNLKRYHGRIKDTGKPALFSPRSINSAGNIVYMVTWEI